MRLNCSTLFAAGLLLCPTDGFAAVRPHHHASSHPVLHHGVASHAHHMERAATPSMSSERATEIQSALIQRGYLSGEPTGTWDASSSAAMQKLQSDNGWQTKLVPDSRALIKLGLGPNNTAVAATAPSLPEAQNLN